jgi:hypothetical protein
MTETYTRGRLVGARVELLYCSDPYTRLRPGDRGTVMYVDSLGTVHVSWDNGSSLGLVPGEDGYRVLPEGVSTDPATSHG